MRRTRLVFALAACLVAHSALTVGSAADAIADRARELHFTSIVLDTHDDTTQRMLAPSFDLGERHSAGHIDIPRMRDGGLDALFLSIWIDGRTQGPAAVQKALDQVDVIHESVRAHPNDLVLARTADEVRRAHAGGKIAVLMGVEGGHMIGNDLRMVRVLGSLGVRYLTLSHFYNDEWADSSTDTPVHNGLTAFGKDVVRELNRQGILVDISHVSDRTFEDALAVSRAPLIASHSSVRAMSDHPRNMSDDMIRALAAKGGVIHINYEKSFLDQAYRTAYEKAAGGVVTAIDAAMKACGDDPVCVMDRDAAMERRLSESGAVPHVSWERIVEHIDHVAKLVGADHVGLGSDFDGANMPDGMEDCSNLPKITEALIRRGYKEDDIRKILGGNTLRVMAEAERVSREMQAQ
jgi:membrane dipeptidase